MHICKPGERLPAGPDAGAAGESGDDSARPPGAQASYSPGSPPPLTPRRVPSSSAGEGCTPSGCGTCQNSSFDFLRRRVTSPAVPAPRAIKEAFPAAFGSPRLHLSSSTGSPDQASQPAGVPWGRGVPEGRCHRNSVQDPHPRRPGQAGEEGSRHRCAPCDHVRPFPLRAAAPSQQRPHSSAPSRAAPQKPYLPPCRPGPACSLARSAPLNWSGA